MCGRFVRARASETYGDLFGVRDVPDFTASYNVAPTQQVLAIRRADNAREGVAMRWGLIPSWAKDKKANLINARAETLFEKPAFRASAKRRRCLIVADGYYEWKTLGPKAKQPYYFRSADDKPFAFAGVWDIWRGEGEPIESCSIVTTRANELSAEIHDRMPVILCGESADAWIDFDAAEPAALAELLVPFPAEKMVRYPVGTAVGNAKSNGPQCIEPIPLA
jgi:putative SOS response-associated peptidase YedK